MSIEEIKSLLPDGSYQKIAKAIGKSYGTINQYFNGNVSVRVSEDTEEKILEQAKKIIEENSLSGLELIHGEQKVKEIKAALAA